MFRSANWMQIQEFSWEHIGNSDTLWFQPISTEIHSRLEWTRDEALQCRSVTSTATEFFDSGWTVAKLSSLGVHLYFFSPHAEGNLRGRLVLWTGFKEKLPPCFFWLCPPLSTSLAACFWTSCTFSEAKMGSKTFSGTSQQVFVTDGAGWDCHQH